MNLQSLVVVILRLLSLNFFLQVAVWLPPQILRFTEILRRSSGDDSRSFLVLLFLFLVGLIAGAVLLWVFALPIARLVTRGVPQDLSFGALSLVDCYSIAFMGVGLFYIANRLPQVLSWTHYLFSAAASRVGDAWKEGVPWYDVSQAFISLIVGVVLFVNGRKWAVALARRQGDPSPIATENQKHEADT